MLFPAERPTILWQDGVPVQNVRSLLHPDFETLMPAKWFLHALTDCA